MIGHANMMFMMMTLQRSYGVFETDEQLGFLPLAHVAGRMFYTFLVIQAASVVNLVENPETLARDIQEVSPSVHFAVPRVWEKQFSAVQIKLKEATPLGRIAYATAIRLGERRASYQKSGAAVPAPLRFAAFCADALVLKNVRRLLGIDACRWLATAAAPIAPELIEWFWALGKPMYECYGQTECSGIATANVEGAFRIGSVGKGDRRRGGDAGRTGRNRHSQPRRDPRLLEQGRANGRDLHPRLAAHRRRGPHRRRWLRLCGRPHEGHHHHRRRQEHHAKRNREPAEVLALHHGRRGGRRPSPYLTCLVMIDDENVTKFAQDNDVPFTNYTSLCRTAEVEDLVGAEIERVNAKFARVETVKKFRLIDQLLDPEDDELTPTQKLKRKVVNEKYADLIEAMYRS